MDTIDVVELNGHHLIEALEHAVESIDQVKLPGFFLQVSGKIIHSLSALFHAHSNNWTILVRYFKSSTTSIVQGYMRSFKYRIFFLPKQVIAFGGNFHSLLLFRFTEPINMTHSKLPP